MSEEKKDKKPTLEELKAEWSTKSPEELKEIFDAIDTKYEAEIARLEAEIVRLDNEHRRNLEFAKYIAKEADKKGTEIIEENIDPTTQKEPKPDQGDDFGDR